MKSKLFHAAAAVLTLALTAAMCKTASLAVNYRYNRYENGDVPYHFYKDKMEYDVLFLGSSHAGCAVYPLQLWHDYGISSYNLAISAAQIPSSYHIFKNAIRRHKPAVAVLDTFQAHSNQKVSDQLDSLHYAFDIIPLSPEKYRSLKDLFPTPAQRAAYLFPYSLFHNRWRELTPEQVWDAIFHTEISVGKGAWFPQSVASPAIHPKTTDRLPEDTVGMEYIRAFVALCNENEILPILMTIPYPADITGQMEEHSVKLLSEECGISYYNLNQSSIIDWDTDLNDSSSHVNMSGGRKVTDWLGKLLREDYQVPDHRTETAYAAWEDDWEAYKQKLHALISRQTGLKSSLMLCNNPAFTARLALENGAEMDALDASEQKLVAQLGSAIQIERTALPGGADGDGAAPAQAAMGIRLAVFDAETGAAVTEKQW